MKKNRRGHNYHSNVTTSEFQLKSSDVSKQHKHRKLNTTFTSFKNHLLYQETRLSRRSSSKDKKPIVEQLNLLSNTLPENNFKLPHSLSKRSNSKRNKQEEQDTKFELFNNQMHYQSTQQTKFKDQKKLTTGYLGYMINHKRYRPIPTQNQLKQRLEKTALEKFKDAISKQNLENQNLTSEKNAEALYLLLKSGRNKMQKQPQKHNFESYEQEQQDQESVKPNNMRNAIQGISKIQRKNSSEIYKEKVQQKDKIPKNRPPSAKRIQNMQVPKNNAITRQKQQNSTSKMKQAIKKSFPPQNPSLLKKQISGKQVNKTVQQQQLNRFNDHEKFDESEKESESENFFKKQTKLNQQFSDKVQDKKQVDIPQKQSQTIALLPKHSEIKIEKKNSQKEIKELVDQEKKSKVNINTDNSKNHIKKSQKMIESNIFSNIVEAEAIQSKNKNKTEINSKKQSFEKVTKQSRQEQINELSQKQKSGNQLQQVLNRKYEQQSQRSQQQKQKTKRLQPPPALVIPSKNKIKTAQYKPSDQIKDEQIQQISLPNNHPISSTSATQNNTKNNQQILHSTVEAKQINKQPSQQRQVFPSKQPSEGEDEDEEGNEGLDELQFYVDAMEDIGQYRVNSRDIYSDKSIDKELIQIYKVCSYYMAHQFLYLTKILHQLITDQKIKRDYYTVDDEQLIQLKLAGQLQPMIQRLQRNIQESKKLLKKCYEECKSFLKKQQQILLLEGQTNYNTKCCFMLTKQFKKIYELHQAKPQLEMVQKRCCFLIEIFGIVKMFNNETIKQQSHLDEIEDFSNHIKQYKHIFLGN